MWINLGKGEVALTSSRSARAEQARAGMPVRLCPPKGVGSAGLGADPAGQLGDLVVIARRSDISWRILRSACITVVWSRPPNCWPILGSESSVSSRHRYIAIWRAWTRTRDRDEPQRSSMVRP